MRKMPVFENKKNIQKFIWEDIITIGNGIIYVVLSAVLLSILVKIYMDPNQDLRKRSGILITFLSLIIAYSLFLFVMDRTVMIVRLFLLAQIGICSLLLILVLKFLKKDTTKEEKDWFKENFRLINIAALFSTGFFCFFFLAYIVTNSLKDITYLLEDLKKLEQSKKKGVKKTKKV